MSEHSILIGEYVRRRGSYQPQLCLADTGEWVLLQRSPGDRPFVVSHSQLFSDYELVPPRVKAKVPAGYSVSPELAFDEVRQELCPGVEPYAEHHPICGKLKSVVLLQKRPEVRS